MRRPSPSLTVAFLALFVALSGVAWAQSKLREDSVGRIHIREGAVGTKQVRNGSLQREDFRRGLLLRGPKGEPGATNVIPRNASGGQVAPGAIGEVSAACEADEQATGGGGGFAGPPTTNDRVVESIPVGEAGSTRWRVTLFNGGEQPRTPVAYVMCAAP